jgi:hypothetical protein
MKDVNQRLILAAGNGAVLHPCLAAFLNLWCHFVACRFSLYDVLPASRN